MLSVDELRTAVDDGSIDTVILGFPDPYGKLMGKRLDASFFLTDVARGTHACDYLFTVDMEMEPVTGYEFSSWESRIRRRASDARSRNTPQTVLARSNRSRDLRCPARTRP